MWVERGTSRHSNSTAGVFTSATLSTSIIVCPKPTLEHLVGISHSLASYGKMVEVRVVKTVFRLFGFFV